MDMTENNIENEASDGFEDIVSHSDSAKKARTIDDDIDEYIFMKPIRRKRKAHSEHSGSVGDDDLTIVRSETSSVTDRHHGESGRSSVKRTAIASAEDDDTAIVRSHTSSVTDRHHGESGKSSVKRTAIASAEGDDTAIVRSHTSSVTDRHHGESGKKHRRSSGRHSGGSRKKKMRLWKKILISIVSVILGLVLVVTGTLAYLWFKGSSEMLPDTELSVTGPEGAEVQNHGEYVIYNGKTYKYNDKVTSILFMGVDNRELTNTEIAGTAGQSDVNVLMAVDTSTGKISMINMSRDIMTEVNEYSAGGEYVRMSTMQLCLAYSFGDGKEKSCENMVNAVERLFYNIQINSYFALDLDGIAAINDSVGGVDVVSPSTIGTFTEGQTYHLEGKQAETFVRIRDESAVDANNARMERQQVYIKAFTDQVIAQTKSDISAPLSLYNAASEYSCTNIDPAKIMYLAGVAVSNREDVSYEMLNVPGEVKMGDTYAEYYVDEDSFYEMFLSVFYNQVEQTDE